MNQGEKLQSRLLDRRQSAFRKYREMMTGDQPLLHFLRFEFLTFFLGALPGGPGWLLRKLFYPCLFKSVGRGVVFGRNITLRNPHKIKIGDNVVFDENCLLDAKGCEGGAGIEIGAGVMVSRNTSIIGKYGGLAIGARANIGTNCLFGSMGEMTIGRDTIFAANCYVGGGMYHMERTDIPVVLQGSYTRGPVIIGDGCWLGAGSVVLDGVTLGRDVVLGAGAVACRNIPDLAVAVGVPARVCRIRGRGSI
jgi:acetyltransferase-like isoleucine patch superfamily enzyme